MPDSQFILIKGEVGPGGLYDPVTATTMVDPVQLIVQMAKYIEDLHPLINITNIVDAKQAERLLELAEQFTSEVGES